ncbi:MAG: NfeD family protein [Bacillota bacterium]|jgi:membrane-bound serine protease (ClpP class)
MTRKIIIGILFVLGLFWIYVTQSIAKPGDTVYVIPIKGTIDPGLVSFVNRSFDEAEKLGAAVIILEIDTYGGRIDSAIQINERALASSSPVISFVTQKAISAGALIALSGEKIFMAPGTTIGAAEPRVGEKKADEKTVSMWAQKLASTAEIYGRDRKIAAAMADADIEIPGLVAKGKLLTLTPKEAIDNHFIDYLASNRKEVLAKLELTDTGIIEAKISPAEKLARWVTNPYLSSLLLTVGIAGIVLELFVIGWGIPGTIGLVALSLFFGGHILAGLTGWEAVLLFIVGIILFFVEVLLIPGFGIAGIMGIIAFVASIIIVSPSVEQAIISLIAALIGTVILVWVSFKHVRTRKIWGKLILGMRQEKSAGYIAPEENLERFLNKEGITITPLRPSGAVDIDGVRVDVVSDGGFIAGNVKVKVVKVEGTRVVVKEK